MDAKLILVGDQPGDKLSRAYWQREAAQWVGMRLGIAGAKEAEFCAGYVGGFKPVYAEPTKKDGEAWYVWFVHPGQGVAGRIVNELLPGTFCDAQDGMVYEHDPAWTLCLGTITRVGDQPLLSLDMLRNR